MKAALFFFLALAGAAFAADVVPSANLIDWSYSGVPGGIPARTTVSASLTSSASSANIQSALDACPSNQVVSLGAGSYTLSTWLQCRVDGVTLRGETNQYGVPTTILNFNSGSGGFGLIDFMKTGYPENNWASRVNATNISSGYTKGSTQVTLAGALANLVVGEMVCFDLLSDDDTIWDNGTEGGNSMGRPGTSPARTFKQYVKVTAINGAVIDFTPPLSGSNWVAGLDPECWRFINGKDDVVFLSGLENVIVNRVANGDGTHNIHFGPTYGCWAKNVWTTNCNDSGIRFAYSLRPEIRDCVVSTFDDNGSAAYGIWGFHASSPRLENNIIVNSPCAIGLITVDSEVIAFNAATNFPYSVSTWLPECMMIGHGGHCYAGLIEGNWIPSLWVDWIHGNSSRNVYVRNRFTGWESGKTDSTRPVNFEAQADNHVLAGNILGYSGYHTAYVNNPLGIMNVDADADATLTRKLNYNTVDAGIHSSSPDETTSSTLSNTYTHYTSTTIEHWGDRPFPAFDYANPTRSLTGFGGTNLPAIYRLRDANNAWPPAAADGGGDIPTAPGARRLTLNIRR